MRSVIDNSCRDLLVGRTPRNKLQDFDLARGQGLHRLLVAPRAQPLRQHARHLRIKVHLAGARGADRVGDLVRVGVLEQVPGCARLQGRGDLLLLDERGDGHDVYLGVRFVD